MSRQTRKEVTMAGFSISKAQLQDIRSKAERMITRAKHITEKSEEAVGQVIQTVEIGGAAFASGLIKGRFGNVEVVGVPADLGAGSALHLLAFFGGGKYKSHLHNFADGIIASYLTQLGAGIGSRMATEATRAAATTPAAVTGQLPQGRTGGLPQGFPGTVAEQEAQRAAASR
jgi:hypothetical protein